MSRRCCLSFLTCISVLLTGCVTSMDVQTDYNPRTDFDEYKEYRWLSSFNIAHSSGRPDSLLIRQFTYAVDHELSKRGFIQTRGIGEFQVVLYRPGPDAEQYLTWATGDLVIEATETDGIILEVVDARDETCVWRGVTDQSFIDIDPEIQQAKVNEAVTRIFDLFPRLPVTDRLIKAGGEKSQ